MTQKLNDKSVLVNAGGFLRGEDVLQLSDRPKITCRTASGNGPDLNVKANALGFEIVLTSFIEGGEITAVASGMLGGKPIVLLGRAKRYRDSGQSLYRVDVTIAED